MLSIPTEVLVQLIQSRPVPLLNYINAHSIVGVLLLLSLCRFHVIRCVTVILFFISLHNLLTHLHSHNTQLPICFAIAHPS